MPWGAVFRLESVRLSGDRLECDLAGRPAALKVGKASPDEELVPSALEYLLDHVLFRTVCKTYQTVLERKESRAMTGWRGVSEKIGGGSGPAAGSHLRRRASALTPPGSMAAQPFDLERARQAVVRVFGDRGNVVGSGSVVSVADGRAYILTAYHVIRADVQRGVSTVQVEFFPEGTAEARISRERMDPTNDLAVLIVDKLPPSPPLAIHWGSSATLLETERVWALGHPRGGPGWVVSDGTVGRKTGARLFFSGTAADAGNSGGPLLDGRGALVGVIIGEGGPPVSPSRRISCSRSFAPGYQRCQVSRASAGPSALCT